MKKLGLIILIFFCLAVWVAPAGAKVKLRVVYQPFIVHNQQVKWMQEWAKKNPDVQIEPVPLSYDIYYPKVSIAIQAPKCEFDIVWHNDDWGQAWINHMEPVSDVEDFNKIPEYQWKIIYVNKQHPRSTAVPFIGQSVAMCYRKDLISVPPKTWKEVETVSLKLMREGKVKFGLVGGMKYPHGYFTILPSMWANSGDVLYPPFERDNEILAQNGWKPFVTDVTMIETLEFWWDQIHKTKTVPPDIVGFTKTTGNAIFAAGEAAMLGTADYDFHELDDPAKSKVSGKVGIAPYPYGPHGKGVFSYDVNWAWGIPKNIPEENKMVAKKILGYLISDEVQLDLWKTTGGIPITTTMREKLIQTDSRFKEVAMATFKSPLVGKVYAAYYFPQWPQVHSIFADYCIKALSGDKKDIKKVMDQCAEELKNVFKK